MPESLSEKRTRTIKTKELEQLKRSEKIHELHAKGYSNALIAKRMCVSESTVRRALKR